MVLDDNERLRKEGLCSVILRDGMLPMKPPRLGRYAVAGDVCYKVIVAGVGSSYRVVLDRLTTVRTKSFLGGNIGVFAMGAAPRNVTAVRALGPST